MSLSKTRDWVLTVREKNDKIGEERLKSAVSGGLFMTASKGMLFTMNA
jgi:hypothetical protein